MIGALSFGRLIWQARALRFLMLCLIGWTGARALAVWTPGHIPADAVFPAPPMMVSATARPILANIVTISRLTPGHRPMPASRYAYAAAGSLSRGGGASGWLIANRHAVRLALMQRLLAGNPLRKDRAAFFGADTNFGRREVPGLHAVVAGSPATMPIWPRRTLAGWSGSAWVFMRDGGASSNNPAPLAQLGGNQAGVRIGYGFGATGQWRGYARAVAAPFRGGQRELAIGIAFAPAPDLPVDFHVEQRFAQKGRGRTALAAMATGGVNAIALPAKFRLDAYAQAGVVGTGSQSVFGDAAASVEHDLAGRTNQRLAIGGILAAAAQPGAARLDVGPRLTLHLPDVAGGSRIALDWRQRIAGNAMPASGLALTLATDF